MSAPGVITIRDVSKKYVVKDESLQVLQGIGLTIQPGEFVSVVGTSGCGKSTLLRLVIGLDGDYEGEILVGGKRVEGTSLDRGIVFQEHRLFPWLTIEENVALGLENSRWTEAERRKTVEEHLDLVGLSGFKRAYPHQLSGGMAQRAAIARGLVNRPGILLLDEPFGALDALTRAKLQQELQRIWQKEGITMVLVTHDVEEAVFLGDRVVVLEPRPGRIKRVIPVNVPHPRSRTDQELKDLTDEVRGHLLAS
ncbi:ABC transporter ATP-binding protein [Sorangium cellulosum]|uniref:ABC transporter ATP-binding protein n=1 Tax=Sorangium cellulosum TaxID=56 RepID=A0A2L0ELW0_SORCE|nr:ABC transporter ATP-binding protein [Sorangium cellulosum]AUX40279.1 ABC transporter ATP-binding protein [Sorangium cellulosum]